MAPQKGGGVEFHLHNRAEKVEVFLHVFGAEGAENVFFAASKSPRKFFEHFFVNLGKFLNEKAIKVDFGMICVEVSEKFQKMAIFRKNTSTQGLKFRKYFITGAPPPPPLPKISLGNFNLTEFHLNRVFIST